MTLDTPALIEEVSHLLVDSVSDVFSTLFDLSAQAAEVEDFRRNGDAIVAGCVGFVGEANGVVYLFVRAGFARRLASQMLGMTEAEVDSDDLVNDVIGELSNMVVGGVKSHLCDEGASCTLTIPSVVRGFSLSAEAVNQVERKLIHFRCGNDQLLLEVQVKTKA
jgi:chemotaxis protein CheX